MLTITITEQKSINLKESGKGYMKGLKGKKGR